MTRSKVEIMMKCKPKWREKMEFEHLEKKNEKKRVCFQCQRYFYAFYHKQKPYSSKAVSFLSKRNDL